MIFIHVREQVYRGKRKALKTESSVGVIPLSAGMARKLAAIRPSEDDVDRQAVIETFSLSEDATGEQIKEKARELINSRPVFPNRAGKPHTYGNVYNRVLHPALQKCGLAVKRDHGEWDYQGIGFHAFRRACGSLLLSRGGKDLKHIQRWLRHSRLTTTLNSYIELVDGGLGSADMFDEILEGKGGQDDSRAQPQEPTSPEGPNLPPEARTDEQPQRAAEA
jgi:integrase